MAKEQGNKGKTTQPPRGNAAGGKSSAAGKRAGQGKKAARPAPPKVPAGKRGHTSRSKNIVNDQSRQAAVKPAESQQERKSVIKRLTETIRRVIGYKKGERDEFRYNYDEGHPGYVFKDKQGKLKSFGVTHSGSTFGVKNMPLEENPDPKDNRPAYIRNGVITSKKKRNSGRIKNMKLSSQDKARVKSKKRNYKKVAKQQNKKSK